MKNYVYVIYITEEVAPCVFKKRYYTTAEDSESAGMIVSSLNSEGIRASYDIKTSTRYYEQSEEEKGVK